MNKQRQVIVIGAGASGLMAAITAAEHGAGVLVLEHMDSAGKKLLLTGNGRCNFTNRSISSDAYYTHEPAFIERFLRRFQTEDALLFFRGLGLYPAFLGDYVYPMSMQAQSVREAHRRNSWNRCSLSLIMPPAWIISVRLV